MFEEYEQFLKRKSRIGPDRGFDPLFMPGFLYDFQRMLVEWSVRHGRSALFEDCGLGKTPQQLVWAENVVRKTNGRILILTPLAVARQTVREAEKFGIEASVSRDGSLKTKIVVANYEQLHRFQPSDFAGCVCDESSILKSFAGTTRAAITDFMRTIPYRLLCTATAAPNDYIELGTSSEALGILERKHMLAQFFTHDGGSTSQWRLKGHARSKAFWAWMTTWARAVRKPSDLGCDDGPFELPELIINDHIVSAIRPRDGCLFDLPAIGLDEQREERRRTIPERCEKVASLVVGTGQPTICWCHLNDEGDLLERLIPGAVQVAGKDSDEKKEEALEAFATGKIRVLVTKPSIAGWGLNWQHCAHQTSFPSHSFEQWYQSVRRSWRFGQNRPVTVDVVASEGECNVMKNLQRKQDAADRMFESIVLAMGQVQQETKTARETRKEKVPSWL